MADDEKPRRVGHLRDVSYQGGDREKPTPEQDLSAFEARRGVRGIAGGREGSPNPRGRDLGSTVTLIGEIYSTHDRGDVEAEKILKALALVAKISSSKPEDLVAFLALDFRNRNIGSADAQAMEAARLYSSADRLQAILEEGPIIIGGGKIDPEVIEWLSKEDGASNIWAEPTLASNLARSLSMAVDVLVLLAEDEGDYPHEWLENLKVALDSFITEATVGPGILSNEEWAAITEERDRLIDAAWRDWLESNPPALRGA